MSSSSQTQLRIVYSLLKPGIRIAAHFGVPIKSVIELVRLGYFEHLRLKGRSNSEIARTFGQSDRHIRSLAQRLRSDFFAAERQIGLPREVEALIASGNSNESELIAALPAHESTDVHEAVAELINQHRVERDGEGALHASQQYVLLQGNDFHHRIDAINHFFDGGYRAVLHRLIFDDKKTATLKTISFSAMAGQLRAFLDELEGLLRRRLADLDETATFAGNADERYILALALAPAEVNSPTNGDDP